MSVLAALLAVAAICAWPGRASTAHRLPARRPSGTLPARPAAGVRPALVVLAIAAGIVAVAAGMGWMAVVPALGVASAIVRRRSRPPSYPELALVCDLVAAALSAGAPTPAALNAACGAAGPVLVSRLREVAQALAGGDPPERAWAGWLVDPQLAAVGRTCVRTGGTGSAAAGELTRTATRLRARRRSAVEQRAARATIWIVLPLGLCFLPAFFLVGVVPIALGLLHHLH